MMSNPLQAALELARKKQDDRGPIVCNLVESSFHSCGFYLDPGILETGFLDWIKQRNYQPDAEGRLDCRTAVKSLYLKALGPQPFSLREPLSPKNILVTASSSESYSLLFSEFCDPGDNILLPLPSYPLFEDLASYAGLEPRFYPLDPKKNWEPELDVMHALMDGKTRFVVLISPNNPCGSVLSRECLEKILALCAQEEVMLISDEVFSEFLYPPLDRLPRPWELSRGVPVFTLNGISKTYACPDLKLGWIMVSHGPGQEEGSGFLSARELTERLALRSDTYLNANDFSQFLYPRLRELGGSFVRSMIADLAGARERLINGPLNRLENWQLRPPAGGIHFILSHRSSNRFCPDDEATAISLLENHGLYVHPGYLYGMDEGCHLVLSLLGGLDPSRWEKLALALQGSGRPKKG